MRCKKLWESPRGRKNYNILKSNCSKIGLSPFLWNVFQQALKKDDVRIPEGVPKQYHIQVSILLRNQRALGWTNFLVGRVTKDWKIMQRIEKSEEPRTCDGAVHLFWGHLFNYYCEL